MDQIKVLQEELDRVQTELDQTLVKLHSMQDENSELKSKLGAYITVGEGHVVYGEMDALVIVQKLIVGKNEK